MTVQTFMRFGIVLFLILVAFLWYRAFTFTGQMRINAIIGASINSIIAICWIVWLFKH